MADAILAILLFAVSIAGAIGLAKLTDHVVIRLGGKPNDATALAVLVLFLATLTVFPYAALLFPMPSGRMVRIEHSTNEQRLTRWACRIRLGVAAAMLAGGFLLGAGPMGLTTRVTGIGLILLWVSFFGWDYCSRFSRLEWMPWDEETPCGVEERGNE